MQIDANKYLAGLNDPNIVNINSVRDYNDMNPNPLGYGQGLYVHGILERSAHMTERMLFIG